MQKMINMCVPIEDPSPVLTARRIRKFGHLEGLLSYNLTIGLITSSKYSFLQFDADPYMLSLIQVILSNHTHLFFFAYWFISVHCKPL